MPERDVLEADVLIVGAGPAGLACALRLAQRAAAQPGVLNLENVNVLEKGREVGAHLLSGAVLDPRAQCSREPLIVPPTWKKGDRICLAPLGR